MATLLEYKCPACGGALEFNSDVQKMKCPYCDTEFEVDSLRQMDEVLREQMPEDMQWQSQPEGQWETGEQDGLCVYICNSCGGEIVGDAQMAATQCPFCDNPVVLSGQFSGTLRPDLVIPFQFDKDFAKEALAKHLQKKPLLPKLFKLENRLEQMQGIYVPFWLFDADADANMQFKATRVRRWSDSRYEYTETSHYSVHRAGTLGFADIPVDGSTKMNDELMESIEPYDLSKAVDFQTAYLAGYLADKYDVDSQQSIVRANERIKASTQREFTETVRGYTTVIPCECNLQLKNSKVRYGLLPVWVLTTKYRDKTYTFAMNGQSGKFVGNLPIDWGIFFTWLCGITLGCGGILYLLGLLLRLF